MPFEFTFDNAICIQCGICADVCPVSTLDFTRPRRKHIEDTALESDLTTDMTEYPIQVARCIGCMICPEECPVTCITIRKAYAEPKYAPRQGPMVTDEPEAGEFALSKYTKLMPAKAKSKDPWGRDYIFIPKRRKSTTGTWDEEDMR